MLWLAVTIVQDCGADATCNTGLLENRTLSPRLQVGTTAFAASESYCGEADTLGGLAAGSFAASSHQHAWSELTAVPAGFSDGVDNDTTYGGANFATSNQACGGTQKVTGISATGAVTCAADADTNTTYSAAAGGGLSLTSTAFSLNSSGCSAGYVLKWDGAAWTCQADADSGGDITGVTAGTGLSGGGTSGAVTLSVNQTSLQTMLDPRYLQKTGGTVTGNLVVSGTLDFGLQRIDCTPASTYTECQCPSGYFAISGGGSAPNGATLYASRPISGNIWRVACRNLDGTNLACASVSAICARIPTL